MQLVASGTQLGSIGVEELLATITAGGVYVFVVDASSMQNLDVLELRLYTTVLGGGASLVAYFVQFANVQPATDQIKYSVPVPSDIEYHVTLKQIAGTARQYPWKVLSL